MGNPVLGVRRPKIDNVQFRALEDATVDQLLAGVTSLRDKALVALFVCSGLRLSELHQLNKDTIMRRQKTLPDGRVRTLGVGEVVGKGGKRRSFLVDADVLDILITYLRSRTADQNPALFISSRKQRLSCRSIQDIISRECQRVGLGHVHVHQLRHTFATRMVNAGMPSIVLKELMGHTSFTATQRYFRIRPERLAREYFAAMEFFK